MSKLEKWGQERYVAICSRLHLPSSAIMNDIFRDDTFKRSLASLREDILRANGLVREANNFAEELGLHTRFSVTLQIPPQNLSPNRKVVEMFL